MPSRNREKRKKGRGFFWANIVAAIILLAAGGYSYAWYHFAGNLEVQANRTLASINGPDVHASCDDAGARGYPLELGLYCSSVSYSDEKAKVSVKAGAFRSAAALYSPLDIAGELDGPARVTLPSFGAVDIGWSSLGAKVRLAAPLPESIRIAGHDIAVSPQGAGQAMAQAKMAAFEARPVGKDLRVRLRFGALASPQHLPDGEALPPLDGAADVTITDGIAFLAQKRDSLHGVSAVVKNLSFATKDGSVGVSGPVSVDDNGLVNAKLSLTLKNPQALAQTLADAAPKMRNQIENAMPALSALGGSSTLPLEIDAGKARLGFIPIGDIPPL